MPFFYLGKKAGKDTVDGYSLEMLHRTECRACPLNHNEKQLCHPKMKPTGAEHPLVYMLGEAPGKTEDEKGIAFVGKTGRVLRFRVPEIWNTRLRWGNTIRCRPPDNRQPELIEIECCRPSIVRDIEATKPRAIFGFGNVPLNWAIQQTGITKWNGRRVPIKVGSHSCWYYPMLHPSFISRSRKFIPRDRKSYGSEDEFAFAMDLRRAFAEVHNLPDPMVHTRDDALANLEWVTGHGSDDLARCRQVFDDLSEEKVVGWDWETPVLRPYQKGGKLLTCALSGSKYSFAFAIDHDEAGWSKADRAELLNALEAFLYDSKCRKVAHHLAFELEWAAYFFGRDVVWNGIWGDTESQSYILDERRWCHSLEFVCLNLFGLNVKGIANVDRKNLGKTPLEQVLRYNAVDAKYHRLAYIEQAKRLRQQGLMDVYHHQLERVPTMTLTTMKGVPVDQKMVRKYYKQYCDKLDDIEAEIDNSKAGREFRRIAGHDYRPSSGPDTKLMMARIAHEPVEIANATTIKEVKHPIAKLTIRWRQANKILSTYVKPLREGSPHIFVDGMLHPTISLTQTRTWRTSSEDPNIQNFPKRESRHVRSQIRPGPNYRVVSFDYASIQARNIAMESHDKVLVQAIWNRYDIHHDWMERIARRCPGWLPKEADKDTLKKYRHRAKNELVFPSFFGARAKSVAKYLGVDERKGEKLHEEFWATFPSIKQWHKKMEADYRRLGYIAGLSGFRRRAPISPNEMINAPIQADEALIVCDAMMRLSQMGDPRLQANMEVHDDLTFIWHKDEIDQLAPIVIDAMLDVPFKWAHVVPIGIEMSVGEDWASMQEVAQFESDQWDGHFAYHQEANDATQNDRLRGTDSRRAA